MLWEALQHLLTPCPRPWRELGYLREQISIDARLGRNRGAWSEHLLRTREAMLAGMEGAGGRRCVLVLGAGLHHDLPLDELAGAFDRVVLADLIHRPASRRAARRHGGRVLCAEFDVTGVLGWIHREGRRSTCEEVLAAVEGAAPGLPAECGGEPDLVVSANLCSQLMLLPSDWLAGHVAGEGLRAKLSGAAARRHLRWLGERRGRTVLVTDLARRRIGRDERLLSEEPVPGLDALRAPDRQWLWRLAPIPEHDRAAHLEHRVGAWVGAPFFAAPTGA